MIKNLILRFSKLRPIYYECRECGSLTVTKNLEVFSSCCNKSCGSLDLKIIDFDDLPF